MQPIYKTIIVDDERPVRVLTKHVLQQFSNVFNIIDEASNGTEAIKKIDSLRPDVIFLDIQMPDFTGFQVLEKVTHKPLVVFLTAYDSYAVKAFDANGIDYLLKPLEEDRLEKTIAKINQYFATNTTTNIDYELLANLVQHKIMPQSVLSSISVKQGNKILLLNVHEIAALESKEKYTAIKTLDGKEYLDSNTLSIWEGKLPSNFLRIQKGSIVNTDHVLEIQKHFNNRFQFVLKDKPKTVVLSGTSYVDNIRLKLNI